MDILKGSNKLKKQEMVKKYDLIVSDLLNQPNGILKHKSFLVENKISKREYYRKKLNTIQMLLILENLEIVAYGTTNIKSEVLRRKITMSKNNQKPRIPKSTEYKYLDIPFYSEGKIILNEKSLEYAELQNQLKNRIILFCKKSSRSISVEKQQKSLTISYKNYTDVYLVDHYNKRQEKDICLKLLKDLAYYQSKKISVTLIMDNPLIYETPQTFINTYKKLLKLDVNIEVKSHKELNSKNLESYSSRTTTEKLKEHLDKIYNTYEENKTKVIDGGFEHHEHQTFDTITDQLSKTHNMDQEIISNILVSLNPTERRISSEEIDIKRGILKYIKPKYKNVKTKNKKIIKKLPQKLSDQEIQKKLNISKFIFGKYSSELIQSNYKVLDVNNNSISTNARHNLNVNIPYMLPIIKTITQPTEENILDHLEHLKEISEDEIVKKIIEEIEL